VKLPTNLLRIELIALMFLYYVCSTEMPDDLDIENPAELLSFEAGITENYVDLQAECRFIPLSSCFSQ